MRFGATIYCLVGMKLLTLFFFLIAVEGVGIVAGRRVDRARFPLPPGVCRWRAPIQDRKTSGASPIDVILAMAPSFTAQINIFVYQVFS
jgi:hypothetical protein